MARNHYDYERLNRRVVRSGKKFNEAMKQLIEMAGEEAEDEGRRMMMELYGKFVETVPKDTARAAAGFNINEEPSEWVPPPGEYKGELGLRQEVEIRKLKAIPRGHTITISSNVEYLPVLEDGHSRQAPTGFLMASINWARRRLEVAAKRFRQK